MILKITLSAERFANLADFLSGRHNTVDALQDLHPGEKLCFLGKHSQTMFALLVRSSPNKLSSDQQDVTLDLAEEYSVGDSQSVKKPVPLSYYIVRLFDRVRMYPQPVQKDKDPFPPGSRLYTTAEDPSFSKTFCREGTLKARKWGVKGTVLGSKYDYGIRYVVEHDDGSIGLYFVTEMRIIHAKT